MKESYNSTHEEPLEESYSMAPTRSQESSTNFVNSVSTEIQNFNADQNEEIIQYLKSNNTKDFLIKVNMIYKGQQSVRYYHSAVLRYALETGIIKKIGELKNNEIFN
jgi:hypothetical protein